MRADEETCSFDDVTVKRETDKAILCVIENEEFWIPKSQISDDSEVYADGHEGELVISEWVAIQKSLV